jgi:rRNA maturation endonuclease Nob1
MMEIWGRCAPCARWFYCPVAEDAHEWSCPVCGSEPIAIENRAQADHALRVEVADPIAAR